MTPVSEGQVAALIGRRRFIAAVCGAATSPAWPRAARAQQASKTTTIGFLGATTATVASPWVAAFVQRLRELGYLEGQNIRIEYRWADGRIDRLANLAQEIVRLNVDIVVTWATAPALAVKKATSVIPVVFALATDPIGSGLVASLAHPGGNVTGMSAFNIDLIGKRLEILREFVPGLRRLAIMANVGAPDTAVEMRELRTVALGLGIEVVALEIRKADDVAIAFDGLNTRADAIFVVGDPLTFTNRTQINTLAMALRLPATFAIREFVAAGGLMSYGPNFPDLFRRAAEFAGKILHGTKPADIPVEQPTKFDFVINLTTAKALGLDVPPMLLARADEVIE
jgi:putative ABC transport system substrate-binding protein